MIFLVYGLCIIVLYLFFANRIMANKIKELDKYQLKLYEELEQTCKGFNIFLDANEQFIVNYHDFLKDYKTFKSEVCNYLVRNKKVLKMLESELSYSNQGSTNNNTGSLN